MGNNRLDFSMKKIVSIILVCTAVSGWSMDEKVNVKQIDDAKSHEQRYQKIVHGVPREPTSYDLLTEKMQSLGVTWNQLTSLGRRSERIGLQPQDRRAEKMLLQPGQNISIPSQPASGLPKLALIQQAHELSQGRPDPFLS